MIRTLTGRSVVRTADRPYATLLQNPQELRLQGQGMVGISPASPRNRVASICFQKQPPVVGSCIGKRTFPVAKQLALQKLAGHCFELADGFFAKK